MISHWLAMIELFVVTFAAIVIGAAAGAATSVPVTNALLSSQIFSQSQKAENTRGSFGRDMAMPGGGTQATDGNSNDTAEPPSGGPDGFFGSLAQSASNYVSKVSYSTDLIVIAELIGVGLLLTLISGLAATTFIMRYEPLKILSNRD